MIDLVQKVSNYINNAKRLVVPASSATTTIMENKNELWRIKIEDETIAAISAKAAHARIHSHGKVFGVRSILYKYLNPS